MSSVINDKLNVNIGGSTNSSSSSTITTPDKISSLTTACFNSSHSSSSSSSSSHSKRKAVDKGEIQNKKKTTTLAATNSDLLNPFIRLFYLVNRTRGIEYGSYLDTHDHASLACLNWQFQKTVNLDPANFLTSLIQNEGQPLDIAQTVSQLSLLSIGSDIEVLQKRLVNNLTRNLVSPSDYRCLFEDIEKILSIEELRNHPAIQRLILHNKHLFILQFDERDLYFGPNHNYLIPYFSKIFIQSVENYVFRAILKNPSLCIYLPEDPLDKSKDLKNKFFNRFIVLDTVLHKETDSKKEVAILPIEFNNEEFLLFAFDHMGSFTNSRKDLQHFFDRFDPEILNNCEVWKKLIQLNPLLIKYIPLSIEGYDRIIMSALKNGKLIPLDINPFNLKIAIFLKSEIDKDSMEFLNQPKFLLEALNSGMDCRNLVLFSDKAKNDIEIQKILMNKGLEILRRPKTQAIELLERFNKVKGGTIGQKPGTHINEVEVINDSIRPTSFEDSIEAQQLYVEFMIAVTDKCMLYNKHSPRINTVNRSWKRINLLENLKSNPNDLVYVDMMNEGYAKEDLRDVVSGFIFEPSQLKQFTVSFFCHLFYRYIINYYNSNSCGEQLARLIMHPEILYNAPDTILHNFDFIILLLNFFKFKSTEELPENIQLKISNNYKKALLHAIKAYRPFINLAPPEFREDREIQFILEDKDYVNKNSKYRAHFLAYLDNFYINRTRFELIPEKTGEELNKQISILHKYRAAANDRNSKVIPELMKDKSIILASVFQLFDPRKSNIIFDLIDPSIKEDIQFWINLFNDESYKFRDSYATNYSFLKYASKSIKSNPSVILAALKFRFVNFGYINIRCLVEDRDLLHQVFILYLKSSRIDKFAFGPDKDKDIDSYRFQMDKDITSWSPQQVIRWAKSVKTNLKLNNYFKNEKMDEDDPELEKIYMETEAADSEHKDDECVKRVSA